MRAKNNILNSWQNLPSGVIVLFFIQIFSTLSFSVLYSSLVLYLTGPLALPLQFANNLMGIFIAFNFSLHFLGGYWGSRFLSHRFLFCIGMLAQLLGCIILSLQDQTWLYLGLGVFLTGSGLNVTCLNCMLAQRFSMNDERRTSAFLYNYSGMNIGFFIGCVLSGYFQLLNNYPRLFLLSSLGNLIALFICLFNWPILTNTEETIKSRYSSGMGLFLVCILPLILSQLLHYTDIANFLVLMTGMGILGGLTLWACCHRSRASSQRILTFVVLMMINIIFWTVFQMGSRELSHFMANKTPDYWSTLPFSMPWFQSINTLFIVIGGPVLCMLLKYIRNWKSAVRLPIPFVLALFFMGLAFVVLPIGIMSAASEELIAPQWMALSFILQTVGELLMVPVGYAMIGSFAPGALQGIMMGTWMLSVGVGAALSHYGLNWLDTIMDNRYGPLLNEKYSCIFLSLGMLALMMCLLMYRLSRRMIDLRSDEIHLDSSAKNASLC